MFRFFCGLILGALLGAGIIWAIVGATARSSVTTRWREEWTASGEELRRVAQEKLRLLHLTTTNIQEELARRGQVVRRAAREWGQTVVDAATDARITGAIKAKYVADPRLSALRISVRSSEGRVFLSGSVRSAEDIGRAILLAMEADPAVREVTADLRVEP
ncbi:MAG: BON domain-containing protein [Verrucomicrobiota bacterium]|nr:BON domain-containing protein [Limisphaera sp.]MDW8381332.1 BON domain-containing protein [Verrucomicrobiota bacterium]